jgi:hypothetical protein
MQTAGGRVFGVVFLVIAVVAIVALLAGYGVPVGVGAVAGFLLGGLGALAAMAWLAGGQGRTITLGRGPRWDRSAGSTQERDLAELRELSELAQVDLGPPLRVIPVLAVDVQAGLAVQLVTAVIHEGGVRLDVEVRPSPGTLMAGHFVRATVSDDAGSTYRAAGQSTGASVPPRYDVRAVPRPPHAAASLTLRIESFADLFPGSNRVVAGPWTFTVRLVGAR